MATEIELKLALSPRAARDLPNHPLLKAAAGQQQRLLNTYYDTADLTLKARRVALRFRKKGWQWLLTVKSAEPASGGLATRSEWEKPASPGVFDFSHVDNPELRATLEAARESLEPVFTTNFRRHAWTVAYADSVIEVALDRGSIESRGDKTAISEVELELISGQVSDLFALALELQQEHALHPMVASKAERGYRLFLAEQPQVFKARPLPLNPDLSPADAFRRIAFGCLEHLQRNEAGVIANRGPEYVHQARVALRRLRSATKLFAPVLPPAMVAVYDEAWRALANALGAARNWDVFVGETLPPFLASFPADRDALRLHREGKRRAKLAQQTAAKLFSLPEYSRLLLSFSAALFNLPTEAGTSLADFARARLAKRARSARQLAQRHQSLIPAERHRMRINFKKLRYTLEFFAPLLNGKRVRPYLAALGQLQDELGMINDHITAEALIEEVLGQRQAGPIHGWIAGRHALLIGAIDESVTTWLAQRPPWKN